MSEIVSNHHQQVNEARKLEINSWNIHLTTTYYYFPLLPLFQYFAWFHISSSNIFIGAASLFPSISWQDVMPWHRLWETKTERVFIVVCSYLIINPHWSISIPGPLFPLHSAALSDKVAGWLDPGRRGFVFINDREAAYSRTGRSYITINH